MGSIDSAVGEAVDIGAQQLLQLGKGALGATPPPRGSGNAPPDDGRQRGTEVIGGSRIVGFTSFASGNDDAGEDDGDADDDADEDAEAAAYRVVKPTVAQAAVVEALHSDAAAPVVLRADVAIEHPSTRRELRSLEVVAHEEPVDALEAMRRVVLDEDSDGAVLEILDNEEPVDQIHRFIVDHALPEAAYLQLLRAVCGVNSITCLRQQPLAYARQVSSEDGRDLGRLEVPLGDEPADAVFAFAGARGLSRAFRRELLRHVCEDRYVHCARQQPYVFVAPIRVENGSEVGVLRLLEDEELADAVFHFARETNITVEVRASLFETLCPRDAITCTRGQALLRELPVSSGEHSEHLGVIRVFEGQEPADVVHAFAQQHRLSSHDELVLLETLCGTSPSAPAPASASAGARPEVKLECNRYAPVVFAVPVAAPNGTRLGVLEVLLNEEPADAIARFGNKHGLGPDEKLNVWKAVCESSGLPCTRSRGLIYQTVYTVPEIQDGSGKPVRELLAFMDGEEPTDVIYEYGQTRNLTLRQRKLLLHSVCNEPRRRPNCTRAEPMLLQIPVWETQHKKMGDLEILEGQEPIDMVYAFLEKHDLFQTEPLNTTLLATVCNSTRVTCARSRPRRILFSLQATYAGVSHTLQYVRPETDWICEQHEVGGQTCVHYVEVLAKQFCATHMFDWAGCDVRILDALRSQLEMYETHMWRGKNLYAKLGLVKSATTEEIDAAYNMLVKRFNNETEPYKYEKLREAYATLSDPEEKYFYDLPCLKFFGLCGKKKKDGSISITCD
ncbi:hypothetical protein PybrP1_012572 [[Pythium] brassicae (nom. inval.)]|nr:hypothetical protein PybrP1_012572 [[Pythium] brassicae (nom. inval.)]